MGYKKRKVPEGYWPYRPGYNWLLGYNEGGKHYSEVTTGGIKEVSMDRRVKEG